MLKKPAFCGKYVREVGGRFRSKTCTVPLNLVQRLFRGLGIFAFTALKISVSIKNTHNFSSYFIALRIVEVLMPFRP